MDATASHLRRPAGLHDRDVYSHAAALQGKPATGARGQAVIQPEGTTLRERIADEIRRSGPIPFSRYMELCLYEPELGYYSRSREKFGKGGDFYTSSDVHAVFGRDVLDWSAKTFPEFFRALRYSLVEQSADLRSKLQQRLAEHIGAEKCAVFDSLEQAAGAACSNDAIVFGNEFFDALPVEVIDHRGAVRVGYADGKFVESFVPPAAEEDEFLDRYGVHPEEGERVEAPLLSLPWIDRISAVLDERRGFLLLIDYGYTREEQLAGRHRDNLMTYRQP